MSTNDERMAAAMRHTAVKVATRRGRDIRSISPRPVLFPVREESINTTSERSLLPSWRHPQPACQGARSMDASGCVDSRGGTGGIMISSSGNRCAVLRTLKRFGRVAGWRARSPLGWENICWA